ncbi:MAG: M28 family peptidase, partial [Planctomycetales bacterium]|nr:M28 family peptidase [Planctomycetales bacterium]
GADDNASGVACLLEFAQAVAQHNVATRRSLLIAFWDSEELGLLGSQHWCRNPTVPLSQAPLYLNIDMVGRLREGRIELLGSRSGYGLRELAATAIDPGVWIDYSWELEPNGDHWNFLSHRVPSLMLHTGLHDDYHRPSDDVGLINTEGVRLVARYLFDLALTAADAEELPKFRGECFRETKRLQASRERTLPALPPDAPRPRVGLSWRADPCEPHSIYLTRIVPGTPAAAAGLKPLERVVRLSGHEFAGTDGFQAGLNEALAADAPEIALRVERDGRVGEYVLRVE